MERWIGKVAVVTGASSGIGAAIAEKLVNEGMVVVGLARRLDRLEELGKKLSKAKGTFRPFKCDVSKESDILNAFEYVKKIGPVYVLINNAGVLSNGYLVDQPTEVWQKIIGVNVLGLCIATREAVNDMKNNNVNGHIIHINSIAGHSISKVLKIGIYSASKYAVTALTETLRREFNAIKSKIRITSISPGAVTTEIFDNFDMDYLNEGNTEEFPSLEPKDIADGVIYVLSAPPHVNICELTIRPVNEEF